MAQWYLFTEEQGADIFLSDNYSYPVDAKPTCQGTNKMCAILAEDDGRGHPVFDRRLLARDFIRAIQFQSDYGMVALSNKYKKKESRLLTSIRQLFKLN